MKLNVVNLDLLQDKKDNFGVLIRSWSAVSITTVADAYIIRIISTYFIAVADKPIYFS